MDSTKVSLSIPEGTDQLRVTGERDEFLRCIEKEFEAKVSIRGDKVVLVGLPGEVEQLTRLFSYLIQSATAGEELSLDDVRRAIDTIRSDEFNMSSLRDDVILAYRGRAVRPKTPGQKEYVDAVRSNTVTVCEGPAGTGKTYLAVAMAVAALKRHEVSRIVLTRPVVEAGESLGYLPGTLEEKVDPYVRPLYDALFDMMDAERLGALTERGAIEVAPLAYMRGRTLNDSFVILDEAQNTTPEQMKMFLTRLGFNSKMVVTGDITQLDLPRGLSGLKSVQSVLRDVDDIAFCTLTGRDVVRHNLVARIVEAYERAAAGKSSDS